MVLNHYKIRYPLRELLKGKLGDYSSEKAIKKVKNVFEQEQRADEAAIRVRRAACSGRAA